MTRFLLFVAALGTGCLGTAKMPDDAPVITPTATSQSREVDLAQASPTDGGVFAQDAGTDAAQARDAGDSSPSNLLTYLQGLNQGTEKRVLAGQHANYWQQDNGDQYGQQLDEFTGNSAATATITSTGKSPAVLGTTFDMEYQNVTSAQNLKLTNDWLAAGGIVQVSYWALDPAGDGNNPFPDVLSSGTSTSSKFMAQLKTLAGELKAVKGTVLFRPFLEQNGNWFWWGTQNRTSAQFVQLWKMTHDYLVKTEGLTNLLFVYAVNANTGGASAYNGMYPGTDYVDVVGFDYYGNDPAGDCLSTYQTLQTMKKPIIIAEGGVQGPTNISDDVGDNSQFIKAAKSAMPDLVAIMIWSQGWALDKQNGATAFMTDSWIIDRSDLPAGL